MWTPDLRTLFLILFLVNAFLTLMLFTYWKTQKTYYGFATWMQSLLVISIGYLLFMLRDTIPAFFSVILGSILVVLSVVMRLESIRRYFSRKSLPLLVYGIFIPFTGLYLYFTYITNSILLRTTFSTVIIVPCLLLTSLIALRVQEPENRLLRSGFAATLCIVAVVMTSRILAWIVFPREHSLLSTDPENTVFFIVTIVTDILSTGFFLMFNMARSQAELRESEIEHRILLSSMPDFVVVYAGDRILYANPPVLHRFGITEEEMYRHSLFDYVAQESRAEVAGNIRKRDHGMPVEPYEMDIITPAGERLTLYLQSSYHSIMYKGVSAFLVVLTDITDRKWAERELLKHDLFLQRLIDTIPNPIFYKDKNGVYTGCNTAFERYIGLPKDHIIGRTVYGIAPKELADIYYAKDKELIDQPGTQAYESHVKYADGSLHDVIFNKSTYFDADGSTAGLVGIIQDITGRKQAEKRAQVIACEWESTFNAASDGICLMNAEQVIQRCNTRMGEILGGKIPEEIVGKSCWITVHQTTEPIPDCPFVRAKETHQRTQTEYSHNGLWFEVIVDPVFDREGRFVGAVHVMRDITGRKRDEAALRQAYKQLNLLSSITRHDIMNQLFALRGYLELSHEMINNPAILEEYIRKEEQAARTIEHQISFTKDYQELGAAAPVWQNVNKSIQKAVAGLPVGKIRVETDPEDPEVYADPLFEKVFYNLIDNALRYGGDRMTTIRISSRIDDRHLTICCDDDGVGCSAADKKKLFTRGFGKNTGLGLFLSREILAITGITITENGEPGKGARFEITVPTGMWKKKGEMVEKGVNN
jgi:PAS domain S-box-containing protein